MAVETELLVKVASGGAAQTVRDVLSLQKSIKQLGKETKDTEALAKALGKAFNLPEGDVEDLAKALAQAKDEAGKLKKEADGISGVFEGIAQGFGQQLTQLGFEALQKTLDIVVGTVGEAISQFEQFESALTAFDAKSDASTEQIARIGEQAKELAAVTSQTPAGVAELSTALLSLGATANDVEANLAGITKLADVLGEDPVLTGQVVQTGLNIFGEFGETADSLTDKISTLINTTAAGSTGGVGEFFQLFQDAGSTAAAAGVSFDELATAFATLRDAGVSASIAGNGIKTVLLSLSSPTSEASQLMKDLGVEVFDASGNFIGLEQTLRQFQAATATLSQQEQLDLATQIFGREGAPAILTLLQQVDSKYQTTLGNLGNAAGAVDETLEIINQSLERQAELLQGNISGALTSLGEALAPIKLTLVQFTQALLDASKDGFDGLDRLTDAGERLNAVLNENPEIAERLGQAIAAVANEAVEQLSSFVDAFADFISNQENVEQIAESIELIGTAISAVGSTINILFDLVNAVQAFKGVAEGIPIIGERFSSAMEGPIGPIIDLIQRLTALANFLKGIREQVQDFLSPAIQSISEFRTEVIDGILQPIDEILQKLEDLRVAALQSLGILGEFSGIEAAGLDTSDALGQIRELARAYDSLREVTGETLDPSIPDEDLADQESALELARQRREEAEKETKAEAERLKLQREDDKTDAQRQFDDSALQRERAEDDRSRRDEQAFNDAQQQTEAAFQKSQQAAEDAFRKGQEVKAEAFQKSLQSDADAFRKGQEAEAKQFQRNLQAERDRGNQEFGILATEVEQRIAIANAQSAEERKQLEEQFEAAEEAARQRRKIEAEVLRDRGQVISEAERNGELGLSPLEQARADFEAGLQAKQEEFQAAQQAAEDAFQAQQQAKAQIFEDGQRALEQQFEQSQQAAEEAFNQAQQDQEREFKDEQRQLEQDFADAERDRERTFKDEQRRLDRQNAQDVAAILESARGSGIDGARKDGGPVRRGGTYLVGEAGPELVTFSRSGYVHTAKETAAMMAQMPRFGTPMAPQPANTAGIEARLDALLQEVRANRTVQMPPANYTLNTQQPQQDAIALEMERMRALVRRSGLG